ncbi:MAG: hypothetical protein K8R25_00475 [Methanosarcinales archaeon]|nr:hypothetical protein [Methanosarcinales archaeon]
MNKKLLLLLTIFFSILILLPIQAAADTLGNNNECFFAYEQSEINSGDTVWNLTGASYPDLLCSENERLNFIIDGPRLEINGTGDNFVYDTSIYTINDVSQIGWLGEPHSVVENGTDWYLSKLFCNENENDKHILGVGENLTLPDGFVIYVAEIDIDQELLWFILTKDGTEVDSKVRSVGSQYVYKTDLNNSGSRDNWVLRFSIESINSGIHNIYVTINGIQSRSPNLKTPHMYYCGDYIITSRFNDTMLEVRLKSPDNSIQLEKGGTVNILCDRFRFRLDEEGDVGGLLNSFIKKNDNTLIGTDVQVELPEIGVILTFENVTQRGWTYVCDISEDSSPPTGFYELSDYYNILTTAKYTGNITICLTYDDTRSADEDNITILHYEEVEDQTDVFAITQDNINIGDTVWNLTAADHPDVLFEGSKETLRFIINGPELEISGYDNFVYDTSIYYQNGEPFIALLDERYYVIESGCDWYLSKMLIDESQDDIHSLIVGETMDLFDGVEITPIEVSVNGESAMFIITRDSEEVDSTIISEGEQYIYEKDLNESGETNNWVIKFNVDSVSISPDNNLVNISGLKQISTDILKIDPPEDLFDIFEIDTVSNGCTIRIIFDYSGDKIQLIKGGVVNLMGDKFRFKLDEQGDVGGILNRQETMWNDITISVDNNTNTVYGTVTDLSGFVIAEPINNTWREMWMGENSPGGTGITTTELQDAIYHWLEDISIKEHILSTADLQEIIALWLLE